MASTTRTVSRQYSTYRQVEKALDAGVDTFNFKQLFTFGAIHRSAARSFLRLHDISFSEDSSFLSSNFVVTIDTTRKAVAIAAFSRNIDGLNCLEHADELLEAQASLVRKNRLRKLVFRSALPVQYAGMDRVEIARLFMAK